MKKGGGLWDTLKSKSTYVPILNRAVNIGNKTQSYCCNGKKTSGNILGSSNIGYDCHPSSSGTCNPFN